MNILGKLRSNSTVPTQLMATTQICGPVLTEVPLSTVSVTQAPYSFCYGWHWKFLLDVYLETATLICVLLVKPSLLAPYSMRWLQLTR